MPEEGRELLEQEREKLLLAGHDALAEEDVGVSVSTREGNLGDKARITGHEECGVEGGEVGDHERGKEVAAGMTFGIKGTKKTVQTRLELISGAGLNLGNGEGDATLVVLLGIHPQDAVGVEVREARGVGEDIVSEIIDLKVEQASEVFGHVAINGGGGGGAQTEGVRDDGGEKQTGDGRGEGSFALLVKARDDGGGGTNGTVDEVDRVVGREVAELVVIDDFDDGELVEAFDGKGELVVVDHDDVHVRLTIEIALVDDADNVAGIVDDRERACLGGLDGGKDVADGVIRANGLNVCGSEGADRHGIEGKEDRGGDVVRGDKDGDTSLASASEKLLGEGQTGGQDDGTHFVVDAKLKDGRAVLDQGNGIGGELGLEDLFEGRGGGAGHEDAGLDHGIGIEGQERLRAEGAGQEGDGGGDDGLAVRVSLVDNILGEGVVGEESAITPIAADHWNGGKAMLIHELERVPERGVGGDGDGGAFLHAVGNLGEKIGDELWRLNTKTTQDVFRLRGQTSGAGRFDTRPPLLALEFSIGDGRNDRIGVRIAVTDDEGLTRVFAHGINLC